MNTKRAIIIFGFISLMVFALAIEGQCRAWAHSHWWGLKNEAFAQAACGPLPNIGPPPPAPNPKVTIIVPAIQSHWAFCGTSGAAAWSWAAWGKCRVWAKAWGFWGWAKAGKAPAPDPAADSLFVSIDTTSLIVQSLDTLLNKIQMGLYGKMNALPGNSCHLYFGVYQNNDTNDIVYEGSIELQGEAKKMILNGIGPAGLLLDTLGDTLKLEIGSELNPVFNSILTYTDVHDSLGMILRADPITTEMMPVPSMTPYGLLVLILLILASAVWLYVQKRRKGIIHT